MKFRKAAATSALVIAALGIAAGTAHADPAPAPAPVLPSLIDGLNQGIGQVQQGAAQLVPAIHWNVKVENDSVVVETDAGSMATDDGQFQVRDNLGNVVAGFPLSYTLDDLEYPIDAGVEGLRAVLTPSKNIADARPSGLLHNVTKQDAFDDAVSAAATQFGIITAIGTLIGTLVGGVGGCALGAFLGTPVLLPGWIGGCLAGAAIGIPLGAAAGLVLTGVPAAIIIGIGFVNRINAPENQ